MAQGNPDLTLKLLWVKPDIILAQNKKTFWNLIDIRYMSRNIPKKKKNSTVTKMRIVFFLFCCSTKCKLCLLFCTFCSIVVLLNNCHKCRKALNPPRSLCAFHKSRGCNWMVSLVAIYHICFCWLIYAQFKPLALSFE